VRELLNRFLASSLMDALEIVYPQYWLQPHAKEMFEGHFTVLKNHYCIELRSRDVYSPRVLDMAALNHQCAQFKGAMKANAVDAMQKPITLNPLTKLWHTLSFSRVLRSCFGEWFKVAELAVVQVLGSVEDERTFSTVAFSKSKLRNHLNEHLSACIGIFSQNFYTLEKFPFDKVYDEWHADRMRQPDC
jgi:hypothetical protein